jgi:serine protease Do
MTRLSFTAICSILIFISSATSTLAMPNDGLVRKLNAHVLRVQVELANGSFGLGSAVVVAKNQVVTNCHVIANAERVVVMNNGMPLAATAVKPDWRHDLCILKIENLDAPIAKFGASKNLKYEQSVFTIGYPNFAALPVSTYGEVKGLYPMDNSMVIRASSGFGMGASGGALFDDDGNLVGVITLKSPGREAYYYNMPVEWVQALLKAPEQAMSAKSEPPFWAASYEKWPYFMQVVHPYLTENWDSLLQISKKWAKQEPNTAEAWYYLAAAEYATNDVKQAKAHLQKVLAMNKQHSQANYYLAMMTEKSGAEKSAKPGLTLTKLALKNTTAQ